MSEETPLAVTPVAETTPTETTTDLTTSPDTPADETTAETTTETKAETQAEKPEVAVEETAEDGEKKKLPGSQRLKRRLQAIEADFSAAQRELDELRARQQASQPNNDPNARPGIDREPRETDFPNDWLAYERAQQSWNTRQAVRDEINRVRQSETQKIQREAQRERLEAYHDHADEVRERIPDFDKVVSAARDVQVSPQLTEEILASDKPALLQYYLASKPEKVRELNAMQGRELAREIGRLESRLHLPTAKKATEASAPPSQVKGGAVPTFDPYKTDDMNAYVAWRRKQKAS